MLDVLYVQSQGKIDHGVLVNWIWRYFTEEKSHGVQGTHQPTGLEDCLKGPVLLSGAWENDQ